MSNPEMIDGERTAIRVRRRYPHPVERVWRALTEADSLRTWFPTEVSITAEVGAVVSYGSAGEGRVVVADAPTRLAFTWGDDLLDFELVAADDATELVLTHHFDDRAGAASFATGWEQCLVALADVLDGRQPPEAGDRGETRHEELVASFALDLPSIEKTETGWTVRFERQLICDADVAWDLVVGAFATPADALGTVTESVPPRRFSVAVASTEPGDVLHLTLGDGTGHGARLILEIAGTDEAEIEAAVDRWVAGVADRVVREAARLVGVSPQARGRR